MVGCYVVRAEDSNEESRLLGVARDQDGVFTILNINGQGLSYDAKIIIEWHYFIEGDKWSTINE